MKKVVSAIAAVFLFTAVMTFTGCNNNDVINPALIPASVPIQPKPLEVKFDDCDDNDNVNAWGGYWFTYDDTKSPNYGVSIVNPRNGATFTMSYVGPGFPGDNLYAAGMWGYIIHEPGVFAYPFIGMGTGLSPMEEPQDLTNFTGIRFWAKRGPGDEVNNYRMSFKHANVRDTAVEDYYGYTIPSTALPEGMWVEIDLPFNAQGKARVQNTDTWILLPGGGFSQQSWSDPLDKTESFSVIQGMQFQTKQSPDPPAGTTLYSDFWVDSIYLYRD